MPRLPAFLTHLHIRALGPVASVPATEALRASLGAFPGLAIAALVARIDAERIKSPTPPGLASAIRVWLVVNQQ